MNAELSYEPSRERCPAESWTNGQEEMEMKDGVIFTVVASGCLVSQLTRAHGENNLCPSNRIFLFHPFQQA